MKSKDQITLEELYQKCIFESKTQPSYYEDALAHPEKYELQLDTIEVDDWDGNMEYRTIAYLYKPGASATDYERFDSEDDIDKLVELFQQKNPEGIIDHRRGDY
jgi:hypothetical protein